MVLLSSLALPGTNVFIGEFLILWGAFMSSWWYGAFGVLGVILAAAYLIWYFERSIFGPFKRVDLGAIQDLGKKEIAVSLTLIVLIFWIGVYPSPVLRIINGSVGDLTGRINGQGPVTYVDKNVGAKPLEDQAFEDNDFKRKDTMGEVSSRGVAVTKHSDQEKLPRLVLQSQKGAVDESLTNKEPF